MQTVVKKPIPNTELVVKPLGEMLHLYYYSPYA